MIWFALTAVALVVIALLWIMPTLLRRNVAAGDTASTATNIAILREQLAELESDVESGTLSRQQYQLARQDLERRVLEDVRDTGGGSSAAKPAGGRRTALALAIAIPLCAALLYIQLGNPDAIMLSPGGGDEREITAQDVEAMVTRLAARLEQKPDDGNGWALLARSYLVMQRYKESIAAYERAAALLKDDAALLADYADAVAVSQGGRIEGKSLRLLQQALEIDPTQWKALALAGSAAFNRKEYKRAIDYWERLRSVAEPGSEIARTVSANLEESRQLAGIKASVKAGSVEGAKPHSQAGGASVNGTVTLSGALAGKTNPSDTVFIFARAAEGPRMPLAIIRRQVKDLPVSFSLDDSQAMSPEMKLSKFKDIVVGARISKNGSATPQSGDLQGISQKIKVGASNVVVVIDSAAP